MKLLLENLPPTLADRAEMMRACLAAFEAVMPLEAVYLFGSHARGDARPDSDVDLCLVSEGAERQLEAAARFRHALWDVWPRPSFTLVPIAPLRLAEKRARGDHFFTTLLEEAVQLGAED
ncbi:MAG: nucleotidyltransferase domain-containing protein [Candidatus Latescibacterota bacterium]|jgi:predicted nucleotidyltransferase